MAFAPVPSTNTSGSTILTHLAPYYLRRTALDALRPVFVFYDACEPDVIPKREGKTITWFRYTNAPAATTTVPEGIVPTSLTMPPSKTVSATASQYADYMTTSDVLRDTAPDAHMTYLADQLGFRAGLTIDNVTRSVIDAPTGASTNPIATYVSVRDFRASWFILQGRNVRPFKDGLMFAVTHPYIAFDLVNDPSANGLADIFKYTEPEKAGGIKIGDRDQVAVVANCRIVQSTNVLFTSGSPDKWRSYVFGAGGVGCVSLSGYEPNQVHDPNKQAFKVKQRVFNDIELANPTGQIGGLVSYNFLHTAKILEGPAGIGGLYRYIYFDAPSSIVS